ncbi:MAG: bifunctional diaminohydroxyphosphoribosylaminopyrimidine deaminase/5-amino-6-(5-phosphoribosylamino)uracil reductase RibD [Candidatus Latescibacterota bacterium]|nr:MAG: bifunctional diaminohydroxyphosphoribosylaminopyrimidine deaminase/5-amino-6-(5-phosphoribosylamino)uracil reductase RibD [Candidatus Latescibacterota bacterium]
MRRAVELAARAYGETSPNPMVGAVLTQNGRIVGEGFHRAAGEPHAEPLALAAARARAVQGRGRLTLYVNLEPCCHTGRTPPCVDAILAAPVERVVAAMLDPNPHVAGRGVARLRQQRVRVEVGCGERQAAELNHVFVARQRRGRPFVALKVALSADGCIAARDGARVKITGDVARRHAHRLRAGYDAILVGVETLARDRPLLDRRLYDGPGRAPRRVVLDPHLRSRAEWLWRHGARPLLFCAEESQRKARALEAEAEIVTLPYDGTRFDLHALARELERLQLWSVLVEGGARTHAAFLDAGVWDRMLLYRNRSYALQGLEWHAADAWRRERQNAKRVEVTTLGGDTLEVFAHPESVWLPGER